MPEFGRRSTSRGGGAVARSAERDEPATVRVGGEPQSREGGSAEDGNARGAGDGVRTVDVGQGRLFTPRSRSTYGLNEVITCFLVVCGHDKKRYEYLRLNFGVKERL